MAKKIGIVGTGNVGSALARGLTKARRDVKLDDVATTIAPLVKGKTVIDVTNALTAEMELAIGYTTSGAEELQKKLQNANVAKAFNTQFAQHMDSGRLGDQRLTVFVAADDAAAKRDASEVASAIGFEAVDAGSLSSARLLEPLGYLNIQLGYTQGLGTKIGLKLIRG